MTLYALFGLKSGRICISSCKGKALNRTLQNFKEDLYRFGVIRNHSEKRRVFFFLVSHFGQIIMSEVFPVNTKKRVSMYQT